MRRRAPVLLAGLLLAVCPLRAFDAKLNNKEIEEALALARLPPDRFQGILEEYQIDYGAPRGQQAQVARLEVSTPFRRLLERAHGVGSAYDKKQARRDLKTLESGRLELRITILSPPQSQPAPDTQLGVDWIYLLEQRGTIIQPSGPEFTLLETTPDNRQRIVTGVEVRLKVELSKLNLKMPLRLIVANPRGGRREADFDLPKLR